MSAFRRAGGLKIRPTYARIPSLREISDIELAEGFSEAAGSSGAAVGSINPPQAPSPDARPIENSRSKRSVAITSSQLSRSRIRKLLPSLRPSGWRFGVTFGLCASIAVLIVNTILIASGGGKGGYHDGIGMLAKGPSDEMSRYGTIYHVLINILSTVLLSASNYCMQVLSSPTREEVDDAHKEGRSFDIGVVSIHNLRYISRRRRLLWLVLAFSSAPLHLFYNSAISGVTSGRVYTVHFVAANDSTNALYAIPNLVNHTDLQWRDIYNTDYVPDNGDLYLFVDILSFGVWWNATNGTIELGLNTTSLPSSGALLGNQISVPINNYSDSMPKLQWPQPFSVSPLEGSLLELDRMSQLTDDDWLYLPNITIHIANSTSKQVTDGSKVQVALSFMIVAVVCNACKVISMYMTVRHSETLHLVTIGDAIASFLQFPDPETIGQCVAERSIRGKKTSSQCNVLPRGAGRAWTPETHRVSEAYSRRSQTVWLCLLLSSGSLAFGCLLAAYLKPGGSHWQWGTASQLRLDMGLSTFDTRGILLNTLLANAPQAILSAVYFTVNGLHTRMASAEEWNQMALKKQPLRVTKPEGMQRSTRFLQLPYAIGVPLLIWSGVLHWLLSQSLFLQRLEIRNPDGSINLESSLSTCGYSPLSLLVFTVVANMGVAITTGIGLRSVTEHIPFGANCSLVLSAACHPPPDEIDPALKPVQWGVVRSRFPGTVVQHCTLSSEEVAPPVPGQTYA